MNKTVLKRGISLLLSLLFIFACFTACASTPDPPHPVMTYNGDSFYYGMEIDVEKLLEKYPNTQVSGSSYSINQYVSLILRETDGKTIVAGYFMTGNVGAKINGISTGDTEKKYKSSFPSAALTGGDATNGYVYAFYYYNDKFMSRTKYQQYLDAARFEGAEAHQKFLDTVCVSTAISNGTLITNICYGDYNAIYNAR